MGSFQDLWSSIRWDLALELLTRLLAVFICLTVHETCHGLVAYALGDPTAKRMHRLSFNPLRHIDWFGLLAMIVVGFGWAKPVPVDSRYFKKPKQGMALCALAGPVSNFLLAVLALFGVRLMSGVTATSFTVWLFNFLILLAILNLPWTVQPDPHSASGRVKGALFCPAGPHLRPADALREVRHAGHPGPGGAGDRG